MKLDKNRTKHHQSVKTINSKRTLRSSSLSDDMTVLVADSLGDFSLPEISNISGSMEDSLAKEEDNEFLRLHRLHSPKLRKDNVELVENESIGTGTFTSIEETSYCDTIDATEDKTSQSKLDSLFKKTKTAISNATPKIRNFSHVAMEKDGRPKFNFSISPVKHTLQRMNDKVMSHSGSGEFRNPLKVFPAIRSKLHTVLTVPKSNVRILTEEEKEKRMNCKTKIIEL